ncbi:hypothetical protein [Planomonospora sp. ID82291]|uniref:hypothetical protein n=1 Tax=Planomonospora sp. ID82291 TaxID=2738136 RepID=UPI0018C3550C|nr:hypothetical protein [Planomonospora sp. ID82291]MBG0818344.1 hypothetical protein [Planomonospora sp. ID82291]
MSVEVRRVPLDFDAPLGQVWQGYVAPAELRMPLCPACRYGHTAAREWLETFTHLLLMLADETTAAVRRKRARGQATTMHPYFQHLLDQPPTRPGDDIEELTVGLAGRPPRDGMHDGLDRWNATKAIITAAGLDPQTWGVCARCSGEGRIEACPGQAAQLAAWQPVPPPEGPGWQLWSTSGDPTPTTPVFATADGLVDHLVREQGYREAAARQVIADGGSIGSLWLVGGQPYHAARDADQTAVMRKE